MGVGVGGMGDERAAGKAWQAPSKSASNEKALTEVASDRFVNIFSPFEYPILTIHSLWMRPVSFAGNEVEAAGRDSDIDKHKHSSQKRWLGKHPHTRKDQAHQRQGDCQPIRYPASSKQEKAKRQIDNPKNHRDDDGSIDGCGCYDLEYVQNPGYEQQTSREESNGFHTSLLILMESDLFPVQQM